MEFAEVLLRNYPEGQWISRERERLPDTIDALTPLVTDLIAVPGGDGALTLPLAGTPAEPAAELLTINQQGRGRQHAGDAARPLGRPDVARPARHPVAGDAPVTRQGSDTAVSEP